MFAQLINSSNTRNGRRLRASIVLLMVPFVLVYAFIWGSLVHLWWFAKEYLADLRELLVVFIPEAVRDLFFILRTGCKY